MKGPLYAMIVLGLVGYCFGGTARWCYSCTYNSFDTSDSSCKAPSVTADKRTCSGLCQKTYSKVNDIISITRSCTPYCIDVGCAEYSGNKACTTCCDTDLCNGAGSVTFNLVAMFTLIATAWGLSE